MILNMGTTGLGIARMRLTGMHFPRIDLTCIGLTCEIPPGILSGRLGDKRGREDLVSGIRQGGREGEATKRCVEEKKDA